MDRAMKYSPGHPFNYGSKSVAQYIHVFADMAKKLPTGLAVVEPFGGVGAIAKQLWPILKPSSWTSIEIDLDCIAFRLEPKVKALLGDAFLITDFGDILIIDPERCTLNAIRKDTKWISLFQAIGKSNVKYVLMQEYGAYWCHLPNHKRLYRELYGEDVGKHNYPLFFAEDMKRLYNLKVVEWSQSLGSTYYRIEKV